MATIPSIIFIVPYRHRRQHRKFFTNYIEIIMEDQPRESWEYYFSHQVDERPFNRGAMKNIGFLKTFLNPTLILKEYLIWEIYI